MDLNEEFQKLLSEWDDDAAHKRFLLLAESLGKIGEAGRLYRSVQSDPAHGERAEKGIHQVLARAMASLRHEPVAATPSQVVRNVGIAIGTVLILFAMRAMFRMM